MLLVGIVIGVLIGVGGILWVPPETGLLASVAGAVVGVLVTVTAHEAGHAVAAWAVGTPPLMIGIGPVHLERGRRIRLRRSFAAGYVMVLPDPETPLPEIARRFRRISLAGAPAGIAASAGLALAGAATTGSTRGMLVFAALMGLINIASLLPVSSRTTVSDAARFRRLRWGRPSARSDAAALAIMGAAFTRPPDEWPPELVEETLSLTGDPIMDAAVLSVRAAVADAAGNPEGAERCLDQGLDLPLHPAQLCGFRAERAYLRARAGRAAEAREDLDALPAQSAWLRPAVRERATAAVLLAEGRHQDARAALDRARAALDDPLTPTPSERVHILELERSLTAAGH